MIFLAVIPAVLFSCYYAREWKIAFKEYQQNDAEFSRKCSYVSIALLCIVLAFILGSYILDSVAEAYAALGSAALAAVIGFMIKTIFKFKWDFLSDQPFSYSLIALVFFSFLAVAMIGEAIIFALKYFISIKEFHSFFT